MAAARQQGGMGKPHVGTVMPTPSRGLGRGGGRPEIAWAVDKMTGE